MAYLICSNCDVYYEIHSKEIPHDLGYCECGNKLEYYETLEDYFQEKGKIKKAHIENSEYNVLITAYESIIAKLILYCVKELPFNVGSQKIIDILKGSRSTFILDNELQYLSSYSIFDKMKKEVLETMVNDLVLSDYLKAKKNPDNPDWTTLQLTNLGESFIKSGELIETNWVEDNIKKPIPNYDKKLYSELRELREILAKERDAPLYVVCGNNVLLKLAHEKPTDPDSMMKIRGIGKSFMTNYGNFFLQIIKDYERRRY